MTRILLAVAVLVTILFGIFMSGHLVQFDSSRPGHEIIHEAPLVPGKLISVGDHKLHLNCIGSGSPTVILEAALGDWSLNWMNFQERIEETFDLRVCAYDRAGYGWSEAGTFPRMISEMADELNALIWNSDIEGPMLLIGHSMGGLITRVFASEYPDNVVGVILIDSTPPKYRPQPGQLQGINGWITWMRNQLTTLKRDGAPANLREAVPDEQIPPVVPANQRDVWRSQYLRALTFETMLSEIENNRLDGLEPYENTTLGDIPLIVIGRDTNPDAPEGAKQSYQNWIELQSEQASISSNGRFIVAEGAGHYVHVQRPDFVIDMISVLLSEIVR